MSLDARRLALRRKRLSVDIAAQRLQLAAQLGACGPLRALEAIHRHAPLVALAAAGMGLVALRGGLVGTAIRVARAVTLAARWWAVARVGLRWLGDERPLRERAARSGK